MESVTFCGLLDSLKEREREKCFFIVIVLGKEKFLLFAVERSVLLFPETWSASKDWWCCAVFINPEGR